MEIAEKSYPTLLTCPFYQLEVFYYQSLYYLIIYNKKIFIYKL